MHAPRWVEAPWRFASLAGAATLLAGLALLNVTGAYRGLELQGAHFWRHPLGQYEFVYPIAAGYWVVFCAQLLTTTRRELRALAPVLDRPPAELETDLLRIPWWLGLFAVGAALQTLATDFQLYEEISPELRPERWGAWVALAMLRDVLMSALWAPAAGAMVVVAQRFSRIVAEHARIDLLEPTQLRPAVRFALRLTLLFVWMSAIVTLAQVPSLGAVLALPWQEIAMASVVPVVLAAAPLALTVRGARLAIRREKEAELARVRTRIGEARRPLLSEAIPASSAMPALLAYEARVMGVREWPLESRALVRVLLYVAIPPASWVAAALVERALNALLE